MVGGVVTCERCGFDSISVVDIPKRGAISLFNSDMLLNGAAFSNIQGLAVGGVASDDFGQGGPFTIFYDGNFNTLKQELDDAYQVKGLSRVPGTMPRASDPAFVALQQARFPAASLHDRVPPCCDMGVHGRVHPHNSRPGVPHKLACRLRRTCCAHALPCAQHTFAARLAERAPAMPRLPCCAMCRRLARLPWYQAAQQLAADPAEAAAAAAPLCKTATMVQTQAQLWAASSAAPQP